MLGGAYGSATLYAYVDWETCDYCTLVGRTYRRIVDSYQGEEGDDVPASRANEDIVISAFLTRYGAPLPPGEITVRVEIYGGADLYLYSGTAAAVVHGALTDVTVG